MARIKTTKAETKEQKEIEVSEIKEMLTERIISRYGSIWAFLTSDDGKKFGGVKLQPYLSAKGPASYDKFRALMKFFKMGTLKKETIVTRTIKYFVS